MESAIVFTGIMAITVARLRRWNNCPRYTCLVTNVFPGDKRGHEIVGRGMNSSRRGGLAGYPRFAPNSSSWHPRGGYSAQARTT